MAAMLLLWCWAIPAVDRQEALESGKTYGEQLRDTVTDAVQTSSPESIVPAWQGTAVPEQDYRALGSGIEDAARTRLRDNAPGQHLYDSALQRPQFHFDLEQDALLRSGRAIGADPTRIIGPMEGAYSGCVEVPTALAPATYTEQRCTSWQATATECVQELTPRCVSRGVCAADGGAITLLPTVEADTVWQYQYPLLTAGNPGTWRGPERCRSYEQPRVYSRSFRFQVPYPQRVEEFRLLRVHYEDHIRIRLNGQRVYGPETLHFGVRESCRLRSNISFLGGCTGGEQESGTVCRDRQGGPCRVFNACDCFLRCCSRYWGVNGGNNNCEQGSHEVTPNLDLTPLLVAGENVLEMTVLVSGTGRGWMQLRAVQNCCTRWQDEWSACAIDADCRASPGDAICLGADEQRSIAGETLHRDCWRRQSRYVCVHGDAYTEEEYCRELRTRGCTQTSSRCMDVERGVCNEYEQLYRCPDRPVTEQTVLRCDDGIYCLGADCFAANYTASTDFPLAASHLSAIESAALDMHPQSLDIFSGTARQCKKRILGFANCCRDSGWGVNLGLAQCSAGERILGEQLAAGQCHYAGSYKTGRLFSKKRYQSYCCFRSRLGRIVQQQGRAQLGVEWGGARHPQCRGLTPQELGAIDFERVDFSDFYGEALDTAERTGRPDSTALGTLLRERLRAQIPQ